MSLRDIIVFIYSKQEYIFISDLAHFENLSIWTGTTLAHSQTLITLGQFDNYQHFGTLSYFEGFKIWFIFDYLGQFQKLDHVGLI